MLSTNLWHFGCSAALGIGFYGNSQTNDGVYQLTYSLDNANHTFSGIDTLVRFLGCWLGMGRPCELRSATAGIPVGPPPVQPPQACSTLASPCQPMVFCVTTLSGLQESPVGVVGFPPTSPGCVGSGMGPVTLAGAHSQGRRHCTESRKWQPTWASGLSGRLRDFSFCPHARHLCDGTRAFAAAFPGSPSNAGSQAVETSSLGTHPRPVPLWTRSPAEGVTTACPAASLAKSSPICLQLTRPDTALAARKEDTTSGAPSHSLKLL